MGLLETAIYTLECENNMFEAITGIKHMQAIREADENVSPEANEEAKKAEHKLTVSEIIKKLRDLWDVVTTKVSEAFDIVVNKMISIFSNDARLIKLYNDKITEENLKGFTGIPNFAFPDIQSLSQRSQNAKEDPMSFAKLVLDELDKKIADIKNASTADEVKAIVDGVKAEDSDLEAFRNKILRTNPNEQQKVWIPDGQTIGTMKGMMANGNNSEIIKNIVKAKADIKAAIKLGSSASLNINFGDDELGAAKSSAAYKISSMITRAAIHEINNWLHVAIKAFAAARKAYITCGRYCTKGAETATQAASESVISITIGEAAEQYVFEQFAY